MNTRKNYSKIDYKYLYGMSKTQIKAKFHWPITKIMQMHQMGILTKALQMEKCLIDEKIDFVKEYGLSFQKMLIKLGPNWTYTKLAYLHYDGQLRRFLMLKGIINEPQPQRTQS
jgi:hypothetical protein